MSSPFDPPTTTDAPLTSNDLDFASEIHGELVRARIPQRGIGGCLALSGGFMLLTAIGLAAASLLEGSAESIGSGIAIALCYGSMALLYLVPAVPLIRAGMAIKKHSNNPVEEVRSAVRFQRTFWQITGGMIALIIGLYVVAIPVVIGLTAIGASLSETFDQIEEARD